MEIDIRNAEELRNLCLETTSDPELVELIENAQLHELVLFLLNSGYTLQIV